MKNSILRFGGYGALIGGSIFAGSHFFTDLIDFSLLEIFGYLSIFTSLSFVFFGIKHFRDKTNGGIVSFGKALVIGLAISAIVGIVIGLLDIVYVTVINPDFSAEYIQYTLNDLEKTLPPAEFELQKEKLITDMEAFDNPTFAGLFMFGIVFTIGIIITVISSFILQRKK